MTWSLASYTAQGAEGFGVLHEDGHARRADRAQALVEHA